MIQTLNKLLARLAANHSRENVLDFSLALLQWMGIAPNPGNKPQLLSPQTQKLKEYLATAPQTVQPQLYRISADQTAGKAGNQNIRVRFAVLKKLRKDTIGQLVDNDPGLSSYQSMVKGLTPSATDSASSKVSSYIPAQPYFIHFVTTPDYDKLVLVFNQGEQKRIVTFRNRLTNTQYHKILEKWEGVGAKSKPEIADLLWKSLDIKEVNKEFYRKIKERYDALLGILSVSGFAGLEDKQDANSAKQFTVRLIGRYIFCWFLKEKGIIPPGLISSENIRHTENYYQTVLLPLFFKTLNTKVQDRDTNSSLFTFHPSLKNIPYLNGGLFDESREDKIFAKAPGTQEPLNLDQWLIPFVEILESYDFTVDESSSQYQQVAVDPEMLGRIFENLLASQNEETEKLANQRKAFGAFYTPREIVDYMINESLKAYLQTPLSEPGFSGFKDEQDLAKKIEPLFAANPDAGQLKKDEKNLLLRKLEQIKILDPACGSGAFPMGMLHKLVELHEVLGTVKSRYELKKDIMSRNIYGVDIMPMAIEIARLRAWLSLVLEENYNPKDALHNFGIKPLPNLDFKFVCANSLIDSGYDEFVKKIEMGNGVPALLRMDAEVQKLKKLRSDYFDTEGSQEKRDALRKEFYETKNYIKTEFISLKKSWALENFFDKIDDWNPFDDGHASSFFSPSWMFGIDKGFDVVIGNPPYVQIQKMDEDKKTEFAKMQFETYERTGDLYQLFYEKGIKTLKPSGAISFITSNKWMRTNYGVGTRTFFANNVAPISIVDFGMALVFESATILTDIFIGKRNGKVKVIPICRIQDDFKEPSLLYDYVKANTILIDHPEENAWVAYSKHEYDLIRKIENQGVALRKWDIQINYGIKTGCNEAFIINKKTRDEIITEDPKSAEIIRPILRGEDINAYVPDFADLFLINSHNGIRHKNISPINVERDYKGVFKWLRKFEKQLVKRQDQGVHWTNLRNCAYLEDFSKPKIIYPNMTKFLPFVYDGNVGYLCNDKAFIITGKDIKYLVGIFNSSLWKFAFKDRFPELLGETREMRKVFFEKIPIKKPIKIFENQIEKLVDEIISLKTENLNTTALEKEIDVLVYKLYELTYEEVKIIEPQFALTQEEYENYPVK